jgi:hypothetical protein
MYVRWRIDYARIGGTSIEPYVYSGDTQATEGRRSGETRDQARRRAGEWAPGCTRAVEVPEEKFPTEVPCA